MNNIDKKSINDETKDILMLNPFGYPRDLRYAFSGYPDLRGVVLYSVLEYRYHDSEGYDHLAIFSKEDMKKLGSIGMNDYYSTTIQHKDCKPIEFVFTIDTDMPTLRALPNPICRIKIWARVSDDDTNFVGQGDSVATEYLRGIFIDHFKIGLEKGTVEQSSVSKDAIIFHRTGSGEGPATQVIYPKSNYVYDIKSVTADVEKKNKEKFQNFVKGWLESQDEKYALENLALECWDMKVLNADHPAGMLQYKINNKKGLHPVFLINLDGEFIVMKWDTMTAFRGRIYINDNDQTISKNIEITYPETKLVITIEDFQNEPVNEAILRQTAYHIDVIMATSNSEKSFATIEANRIDMFRHIKNAIGWKHYYVLNPAYKEIEERVDLSSYTTFDLLRKGFKDYSFDLSDAMLIVHQTEVVVPSIVPLGGGITRTMNVTYGGYPIKVDVHFDTTFISNGEGSKESYGIILHVWASCKTKDVEKYYDFQKTKGITEGLGDMLAKNIAATVLGQFNISLANMK